MEVEDSVKETEINKQKPKTILKYAGHMCNIINSIIILHALPCVSKIKGHRL